MRLKGTVRYDGSTFAGWQIQPGRRTVQGELEAALSRIAGRLVRVQGAGRTDAGVHALGQVMSFDWPDDGDWARLPWSLSSMLAPDVQVVEMAPVPEDFNARHSATGKRYAYSLYLARDLDPFSARYAWGIRWPLNLDLLRALAREIEGEHDFAGFQCVGSAIRNTARTLFSVKVIQGGVIGPLDQPFLWRIEYHGNGFLYKMVRNLTGTIVDIARGKIPRARLGELLQSPGPFHGQTAPAHGLTLLEVQYDGAMMPKQPPAASGPDLSATR